MQGPRGLQRCLEKGVPKGLRVSGFWDATELGALGKTGLCSIGPLGFRVYRALEFRADRVFC